MKEPFSKSTILQIYNQTDKEGLRRFLLQHSAQDGKINAQQLG